MVKGVSEIKILINSSYQFYAAQEDMSALLRQSNPYYECFLEQLIPSSDPQEKAKFLESLQENRFPQAYERLTKACFNFNYEESEKQGASK